VAIGLIGVSSMTGYEYSYYGRKLGIAKSQRDVYDVIEALGDKLSESAGANISLDVERDITFEKVYGFKMDIDSQDDILNTLTYMKDLRVEAYAVCINGEPVVYVDNEVTADSIIDRIKDYFTPAKPGYEYLTVSIAEEVTVQPATIKLAELWNPISAVRYITTGTTEVLQEGEEAHPKVTVFASANVTEDSEIAYSRKYRKNNNLYVTEEVPVSEGKPGVRRTVSLVQIENGIETSKVEQSSTVVQNPVDEVYETGTKPLPATNGSGTWIYPLKGNFKVTSRYGSRNTGISGATRNHQGADLYQPAGSKIYASDGGVVAMAGWYGNLGLCVRINHGGLYETFYGHCSKLLVSAGQTVAQGQTIALIGSTGVVSGPHLHFEVHFNGHSVDPVTILPRLYLDH
jgi:murein DD-endopeptidase MepM/ murein hydrolase activator NlpD